jgi:P-type Ca2+ transporter type 2C
MLRQERKITQESSRSPAFDVQNLAGLSEADAARQLRVTGYNELLSTRRRSVFYIALEVVREPMFLLLVACGLLYMVMGELTDALMLMGFVFVVMGITIVQERRTERALEALKDLSSPRALVIRDGVQKRIPGREVVPGDIVLVSEGDRVPADAVLLHGINLSIDESLLTGESVPVRKSPAPGTAEMGPPGGDDLPFLFSGTLVTAGQGVAEVSRTGMQTELGKIGKAIHGIEPEKTLLQIETGRLVRYLAIVGIILCLIVVAVYGLTRGNSLQSWQQGMLAGITMAMATLPEELPVVLTIFLALGAWRISQKNVLTRRMPAIETLGAATVLCVDKTGTLTLNQMSVRQVFCHDETFEENGSLKRGLPEMFHRTVEFAVLASKRDPFDPMEKAIQSLGEKYLANTEHVHGNWTLVHEYPLSPELLALSHVWKSPDGTDYVVAAKGAPEAIADLCHFDATRSAELSRQVAAMACQGLRVIAVAEGHLKQAGLPFGQHDVQFKFLGLIGLADPVRAEVPEAIQECYRAGVRVVMITGDYPATAQSIGREIGLKNPDAVISGADLAAMGDEELAQQIRHVNIFARVVPEQKLRIVNALKANREIVAMTGDGVNDAPALKSAHIGVAMGGRGTDVAREASALVLLQDDFSSIVQAVKMGRRIFDNIKKAVSYIFAIHVPIAGLSMIPVFFSDWPLLLLPIHVVFLELIIDPSCSIIFEAEGAEPNAMRRPPRNPRERLFTFGAVGISLLQGASVLAILLIVFWAARHIGHSDEESRRALVFATLVVSNLGLILTNRSWSRTIGSMLKEPNAALWWVIGGAATMLSLVLSVPFLQKLFHFGRLHIVDVLLCVAAGIVSIAWFEILKILKGRWARKCRA